MLNEGQFPLLMGDRVMLKMRLNFSAHTSDIECYCGLRGSLASSDRTHVHPVIANDHILDV